VVHQSVAGCDRRAHGLKTRAAGRPPPHASQLYGSHLAGAPSGMTTITTRPRPAPRDEHRAPPARPATGRIALAALATWRVTHLLAEEDGPFDAIVRLRARVRRPWLGELMDCFYCLSLWAAAPVAVAATQRRRDVPITLLALSGAACLLERARSNFEQGGRNVLWEEPASGGRFDTAEARKPTRYVDAAPAAAYA